MEPSPAAQNRMRRFTRSGTTCTLTIRQASAPSCRDRRPAIRYRRPPQAIVAGTVTDANDRLPIAGAVVKALQGVDVKGQTTTDASGHFQLRLFRGSYGVQAERINYITSVVPSVSLETE